MYKNLSMTERFTEAMEEAGYDVRHYHGRFYWHGPAVECEEREFQDVLHVASEAGVKVQWDSMGLGSIVYPITSEPGYSTCGKEASDANAS